MRTVPQSKQEWLELLVKTSREGGFPATENHSCRYRCQNGRACAVGLLISDEDYSPDFEGAALDEGGPIVGGILHVLPEWSKQEVQLLQAVQAAHDDISEPIENPSFWDHDRFCSELRELFPDCVFPEDPAPEPEARRPVSFSVPEGV